MKFKPPSIPGPTTTSLYFLTTLILSPPLPFSSNCSWQMGERAAAAGDDVGDGMQCADHPHRASPGGICAFCLQEKLGKLVSSSSFFPPLPPTSSTSSTSSSFRSSSDFPPTSSKFLTFLNTNNKKQQQPPPPPPVSSSAAPAALALKRSKSVAPRPLGDIVAAAADSPRKKSFWSFLSLSSSSSSSSAATDKRRSTDVQPQFTLQHHHHQDDESTIMKTIRDQDEESPGGGSLASSSSFGRKVSRSRSVGCGSRSFSGDFLERISTGFGDCALRRVESQRESSNKHGAVMRHRESRIKERVRCGGIFGGFGMMSSSSSSLWLSAAAEDEDEDDIGSTSSRMSSSSNARRSRNWGWAFASPMRAFKPVVLASKSFGPANAVAGINSSTRGARIGNGNGNPQSSSLAAVVGS